MSILLLVGKFLLWALFTLVSGLIGGYGLAAGFDAFKKTKEWMKNKNYINNLEEEMLGAATKA